MTLVSRTVAATLLLSGLAAMPALAEGMLSAHAEAGYSTPKTVRVDSADDDDVAQMVLITVQKTLHEMGISVDDASSMTLEVALDWNRPEPFEGQSREDAEEYVSRPDLDSQGDHYIGDITDQLEEELLEPPRHHFERARKIAIALTLYARDQPPIASVTATAKRDYRSLTEQAKALAHIAVRALGTNETRKLEQ